MKRKIISLLSVLLMALTLIGCQEKDVKYTVTFDSNGGSLVSPIEVKKGDKVIKPESPIKDNYDFENWYEDVELQKKWEFETKTVESNVTLYAKWTEKTSVNDEEFTVVFNLDYDELKLANQNVKKGQLVNKPNDPVRAGYEFLGWFIGETKYDFTKTVESNITLTAKWKNNDPDAEEFVVIFDLDYDELILVEKTVLSGNKVDKPNDPVRAGYEFLGWFLGNSIYIFDQAVTKDLVLVAHWKSNQGPVIPEEKIIYEHNFQEDELVSDYLQFGSDNVVGSNYGEYSYNGLNYQTGFKMNSKGKITFNLLEEKAILVLVVGTRKDIDAGSPFGVSINGTRTAIMSPYQELKIELNGAGQYVIQRGNTQDKEFGIFFLGVYTEEAPKTMYTVTIDGTDHLVEAYDKLDTFVPTRVPGKVFMGLYDQNDQLFSLETPIISNITLVSKYRDALEYEVTLDLDGGILSDSNEQFTILEGELITLPKPTKDGMRFAGWYKDELKTVAFTDKTVNSNMTLYAKWVVETVVPDGVVAGVNPESIFIILEDKDSNVKVEYKEIEDNEWQVLDDELIRVSNGKTRIDIVGIKAGLYDVSITTSQNLFVISNLFVKALDRSGYAHFNYTEGIGGYKDDGTLKDDAVVVYVTEQNKNNIEIPGVGQKGLGWILNNAQYAKAGSNTNDPAQYASSLANFNRPIVFRIIGKVTAPEGVTEYNSLINGGTKGDNGNMARIKDANHITIEGIGSDAEIYGWGIHFMASVSGRGIGFEARNLTFKDYPEDAIGLEGVQSGGVLTAPVQRGWLHHLTFYPGFSANPAESDKANGDGSLDIKRGEYFTIAYTQFIGAHKTNLVGASDSNLQFHITYHHNHWLNVASRVPLTRQANVHMYNNVFEITDDNPNQPSYMQNTRANAYIYSEANYFYGAKNPSRVDAGAIKSFNDVKYSTYEEDGAIVVTNREEKVKSGNKFEDFDTNPAVFYYDTVNKRSDVTRLTDAVTARKEVYAYSGAYKDFYKDPETINTNITDIKPTTITESVENGVGGKIQKGQPFLVFKVDTDATFTMTAGSSSVAPALVDIYGRRILTGSGTVMLEEGIYVIESSISHGASKGSSQAKESSVGSYSIMLDSGAAKEARINAAREAIAAIPSDITYDVVSKNLIEKAKEAYNVLKADEKELVDATPIFTAETAYNNQGVIYVEGKINAIGTVTQDSRDVITEARAAYNQASTYIKNNISNYDVLMNAEAAFESFYIIALNQAIADLESVDGIALEDRQAIINLLGKYNDILSEYENIDEDQKNDVVNIEKVLTGVDRLNEILVAYQVIDYVNNLDLENITLSDGKDLNEHMSLYQGLNADLKALVSADLVTKLEDAILIFQEIEGQTVIHEVNFQPNIVKDSNNYFNIYKGDKPADSGDVILSEAFTWKDFVYEAGVKLRLLKMESNTRIEFKTYKEVELVIIAQNVGSIEITYPDGNTTMHDLTNDNSGSVLRELSLKLDLDGNYSIRRVSGNVRFAYISVTE